MSPLMLHCGLCGRKQADGMLSRAAWGHVALPDGTSTSVCPQCKAQHGDWERRVRSAEAGAPPSYGADFGGSYRDA